MSTRSAQLAAAWRLACGAGLLAVACYGRGNDQGPTATVGPTIELGNEVASYQPAILDDPIELTFITWLDLAGDTVALADYDDHLVLLSTDLKLIRNLGRHGEGPGELEHPAFVTRWQNHWVAADYGNARLTVFDAQDKAARSTSLAALRGHGIALTTDGTVFYPKRSDAFYARRVDREGNDGPWAPRAWPPGKDAGMQPDGLGFQKDFLAVTAGDTLHVLDGDSLIFSKYTPQGDLVARVVLPPELREPMLEGAGSKVTTFAGRPVVSYRPAVDDMKATPSGDLLISFRAHPALEGIVALLVDPHTYAIRPISARSHPWVVKAQSQSYFVAASADRFVFATWDGRIGVFVY